MATILVIDDSAFQHKHISRILEHNGYTVLVAADGESGLRMLKEEKPDCIISDLIMPGMDGFMFLETLQQEKIDVPVIVLTADIQSTTTEQCMLLGAFAVIHKPPNGEQLVKLLTEALSASEGST